MSQPAPMRPHPAGPADPADPAGPEIAVANSAANTNDWAEGLPGAEGICRRAALAAIGHLRPDAGPEMELSVVLTDDAAIRDLNRAYRGRDQATNVLSFPASDVSPPPGAGAPTLLGDVVLSYQTVRAEADRQRKRPADHLAHLIVHGTLHLFGYDHEADDQAEAMERLEVAILRGIGISDPYAEAASALT